VIDPDGDSLTYGFRVYGDSLLTDLVASANWVAPGTGTTSWLVDPPLSSEGLFWWRAFAADTTEWGPAAEPVSFVFVSSGPPPVADLRALVADSCVVLIWSPIEEAVGYVVYRDSLVSFIPSLEDSVGATPDTSYVDCEPSGGRAYYVVRAVDAAGRKSEDSMQVGQFQRPLSVQERGLNVLLRLGGR
jgi:hypothetical protein